MSDIKMSLDDLIEEFNRRSDLKNNDDDYIVSDDTQVGIEFAFGSLCTVQECNKQDDEKEINSHDALVEQNKVLRAALVELMSKASECDSWETFPDQYLYNAQIALEQAK